MESLKEQVFIKKKLSRLYLYYGAACIIFMASLTAAMLCQKYEESLNRTIDKLYKMKTSSSRIDMAVKEIEASLPDISKRVPSAIFQEPSEKFIFAGLDIIKSRMAGGEITFGALENKDTELRLSVTVTGTISDYRLFVRNVGDLQSMRFPFLSITGLSLSGNDKEGKGAVAYEVQGVLSVPKNANASERQDTKKAGS